MVFILTRSSVPNGVEFFQGYALLDDLREEYGCLNSRYFTNHLNQNVITILSEWPQVDNFYTYVQTYSETFDTDVNEGRVHLERLEKRLHRIIKTTHTDDDFYILARLYLKDPELYFQIYPQIYPEHLLATIGLHEVEFFGNLNNPSRMTVLSRWESKQGYDEWFHSDLRQEKNRLTDLTKYIDNYELIRM